MVYHTQWGYFEDRQKYISEDFSEVFSEKFEKTILYIFEA